MSDREPIRYDQTPDGCWAACIAGLTGLSHNELAAFVPHDETGALDESMGTEYHNAVNAYLRAHGWRLQSVGADVPRGFSIGSGTSSRGIAHACIVRDGVLWHDPHPSREGIATYSSYELLVPLVVPVWDAWDSLARFAPDCYAYAMVRLSAARARPEGSHE